MVQRVAIAGFGAIGRVVAEYLDRSIDGLTLAAVSAHGIAGAPGWSDGDDDRRRATGAAPARVAGFARGKSLSP